MTEFWRPTQKELNAITADAPLPAKKSPQLLDNYLFHGLYNFKHGLYAKGKQPPNLWSYEKGVLCRKKTRFSRREWIERFFKIRDTDEQIVPLILNQPQRNLEATILRMQRAGFPVRVIILKARKLGFTTYIEAVMAHEALRRENFQALIISDTADRAELTLSITNIGLSHLAKGEDGAPWKFKMASDAAYFMQWEAPINSSIVISSAKQQAAGRGGTPSALHGNETAYWENPERTAAGAMASLPERAHTMGFQESTANSCDGWFPEQFWTAWKLRDVPLDQRGLAVAWIALFFAYYEHPDAFWSKARGVDALPDEIAAEIATSLTDEEAQILQRTYHRRWTANDTWAEREGVDGPVPYRVGVGQQKVTFDQLAWWRTKLNGPDCNGDINIAHREWPWCPEVAFTGSGNPVFSQEIISEMLESCREPIWQGDIVGTEHSDAA